MTNSRNTVFRSLSATWTRAEMAISAFTPTANYQQAGVAIYGDDDNYVYLARNYVAMAR